MSLGNFTLGSTVRIPLQILEQGGIPVGDATNVKVQSIIKPDLSRDNDFPKFMNILDISYALYYLDYTPQSTGNYIVIYSIMVDSVEYSQIESFYVSSRQVSGSLPPTARPG